MTDQERTNDGTELPEDIEIEAEDDIDDIIALLEAIDGGEGDDPLGDLIAIVARS